MKWNNKDGIIEMNIAFKMWFLQLILVLEYNLKFSLCRFVFKPVQDDRVQWCWRLGRELVFHCLLHHIPLYIMLKDVATAASPT